MLEDLSCFFFFFCKCIAVCMCVGIICSCLLWSLVRFLCKKTHFGDILNFFWLLHWALVVIPCITGVWFLVGGLFSILVHRASVTHGILIARVVDEVVADISVIGDK